MKPRKIATVSPARIILTAIVLTIIFGTLLLALPISRTVEIPLLDLLFTATSATSVTGLLTIPLSNFSTFGLGIILIMMQIGGLGLVTLSLFLMSLFVDLGFVTQLIAGQVLELDAWKHTKRIISFIIGLTFVVELLGATSIFLAIRNQYNPLKAVFYAIFHSVSAFCDAGFSLFPDNMILFRQSYHVLITLSCLMFVGGLGFITWREILHYLKSLRHKKRFKLSLHSRIVLYATTVLLGSSSILFWILERHNTLENLPPSLAFLNSIFYAISNRTTGFTTVYVTELQLATLFMIMIMAFIGSAPGSTGSGIKTTTLAIFIATVKCALSGRNAVAMKGRTIPNDQVHKALAIIFFSIFWILLCTFCLLITEKTWQLTDILFETVSAFATLGLSTGITPYLSITGKLFIIVTMVIGRIGPLTVVLAILRRQTEVVEYSFPEERVMLG